MAINYPQRYDDDFINIIKKVIDHVNEYGKTMQDLVADGQLTEEQYANLINTVNGMLKSGEVDDTDLTAELKAKIDDIENKVDKGGVTIDDIIGDLKTAVDDISNKVDKDGNEQVTWGMLDQTAKENITGGNTPVVGTDSVNTSNIVDGAVKRDKMGVSSGSMQDGVYFSIDTETKNIIKRVGTSIEVKFPEGTVAYYKNIESNVSIYLQKLNYTIPHNYSLVYTVGENTEFKIKNTNSITNQDVILIVNHDGLDKINNLKEFTPQFNEVLFTTAELSYQVNESDNSITVFFEGRDNRIFTKQNVNGFRSVRIELNQNAYDVPHNHLLVYNTGDAEIITRNWDELDPEDVVFVGNYKGRIVQNNIGIPENPMESRQFEDDLIYYAETVKINVRGTDIDVIFKDGDTRIFYKDSDGQHFINIGDELLYTVKHNESLVLNKRLGVLETVDSNNIIRGNHLLLITNHKGLPKKTNIRVENEYSISDAYTVNGHEKSKVFWDVTANQGIEVIDDFLLSFNESLDDHSNFGNLYLIDITTMEYIKTVKHNLGHVNSCDYDAENDRMIIGNNTGAGQEKPPAIHIFNNAKNLFTQSETIDFNTADKIVINLFTANEELGEYGVRAKPNAVFGENDDIIYIAMNDNKIIYRCFLGKGANDLTSVEGSYGITSWGDFIEGKGENEYNGTLKILGSYPIKTSFGVNQGIEYYNGKIMLSSSHDKILTLCYELKSNGTAELVKTYNADIYDGMGNRINYEAEGICVNDGKLYQSFRGLGGTGYVVTPL